MRRGGGDNGAALPRGRPATTHTGRLAVIQGKAPQDGCDAAGRRMHNMWEETFKQFFAVGTTLSMLLVIVLINHVFLY